MGKTTFIQNLLDLAPENWIPVMVNADVMLQPDALLAYLAGLFDQNDRSERLFDDLILYFEDLRHDGFLPVIIVDDAHLLPEASVITLLRLHERSTDERPLAQILLFAEPEIDELLKTPQLRVMNLQSLQLLDMPEFTLEQTGLFLEHLLSAHSASSVDSLTDSQIEEIHTEAGGSPGLIREHAKGLMVLPREGEITKKHESRSPSIAMLGGGAAIIVVLLVLIFQDDINSLFSGKGDAVEALQSEAVEPEGYKHLAIPDSEQVVTSEAEEVASANQDLSSNIELAEGKDSDLGPVSEEDGNEPDQADVLPQEQATETPADPGSVGEGAQPEKKEIAVAEKPTIPDEKDNDETLSADKKIGVKSAPSEEQPTKPVDNGGKVTEKNVEKEKAATSPSADKPNKRPEIGQKKSDAIKQKDGDIKQQIKQPSKSVVTEKKSAPEEKAEEVIKKNPAEKKVSPSAVSTAKLDIGQKKSDAIKQKADEIKSQIKQPSKLTDVKKQPVPQPAKPTVKSSALEVSSKPKPIKIAPPASTTIGTNSVAAPVEERSMALVKKEVAAVSVINKPTTAASKPSKVVPKQVAGGFLREQWLLRQKPSSYTIQLVGLQDEKGIAKFIRRHSLSGPIAYYRTQRSGKPWYPVLYGVYPTRGRASAARSNLPESVVKTGPWVRSLNAVQKDIRAR
jgi:DamX protein